jgi:branched-chain amino acid aminotransferase
MKVSERELSIEELLERAARPHCEAGLTGTAAVLAAVGTLIHEGREYKVGDGKPGPIIRNMRDELNAIQWGQAPDTKHWLTHI